MPYSEKEKGALQSDNSLAVQNLQLHHCNETLFHANPKYTKIYKKDDFLPFFLPPSFVNLVGKNYLGHSLRLLIFSF